jgi:hypothetical protein
MGVLGIHVLRQFVVEPEFVDRLRRQFVLFLHGIILWRSDDGITLILLLIRLELLLVFGLLLRTLFRLQLVEI